MITYTIGFLSYVRPSLLKNKIYDVSNELKYVNMNIYDILSLDSIRSSLIRQEETIIFALMERSRFHSNDIVYKSGGFEALHNPSYTFINEEPLSFLQFMIMGTEQLNAGVGRYASSEEHLFFPGSHNILESFPSLDYPEVLSTVNEAHNLNYNSILLKHYISSILPSITVKGYDEQHGLTVLADIAVLQALSRRVHNGKIIAELKYKANSLIYNKLVQENDSNGVRILLTNSTIERKVIKRAGMKAFIYGQEVNENGHVTFEEKYANKKIDPSIIERIYRKFIIPLTKDIEVEYLFKRCGRKIPDHTSEKYYNMYYPYIINY